MAKENEITEGFGGMDFSGDSKLFNKMPNYKSRAVKKRTLNELRQTKDSVYKNPISENKHVEESDILSTVDELNQYLLGNVTEKGLTEALQSLLKKLKK